MKCKKVLACLFSASMLVTMGVATQAIDYKPLKKSQVETAAVKLYKAEKVVSWDTAGKNRSG
ncbi:hypothetical protein FACS189481_0370 [Clostridia bacterium]|nr:hypothetical protein FACS189481_0370 [Clostridia bacterium]